ncbi:MAG TPA: hypothetical protein VGG74_24620 [Kofleriaceae bacterium]|jgi:hypothetical protein
MPIAQAARKVHVTPRLVLEWIHQGRLDDLRADGQFERTHVDIVELESFMASREALASFPFGKKARPSTTPRRVVSGGVVLERVRVAFDDARIAAARAWTPKPGLPGPTRASCPPSSKPCPYIACRHHLATNDPETRAGRRWPGYVPEPEVRALWLDPNAETCSLRVADRVAETGEELPIADLCRALGLHDRRVFNWLKRALTKLGIEPDDIHALTHDATQAPRKRLQRDRASADCSAPR